MLLLTLPEDAFRAIVPVLIALSCVLVVLQPWLTKRLAMAERRREHGGVALFVGVFLAGVYGGYFGAAQGVLLIALLGLFLDEHLQRVNAAKNVLAGIVNAVAAIVFIVVSQFSSRSHVAWLAAVLIAVGSVVGGQIGARIGRRTRPVVLRGLVVVVGIVAIVQIVRG